MHVVGYLVLECMVVTRVYSCELKYFKLNKCNVY